MYSQEIMRNIGEVVTVVVGGALSKSRCVSNPPPPSPPDPPTHKKSTSQLTCACPPIERRCKALLATGAVRWMRESIANN